MLSRRSAKAIADAAGGRFNQSKGAGQGTWTPWDTVYEYFYEQEFASDFCNGIQLAAQRGSATFREFLLRLHTGESVSQFRQTDEWETPDADGQAFLVRIAESFLQEHFAAVSAGGALNQAMVKARRDRMDLLIKPLKTSLELDGYMWADGRLVPRESAPVDAEKHRGLISVLAKELRLSKLEILARSLKLSEDAYQESRWEDCVGNARKSMELVFQECAAQWSKRILNEQLAEEIYKWPIRVRGFLKEQKLLTEDEAKAIAAYYGLFSGLGNHPNMAQNDQARMARQVALILAEFVMLRTHGAMAARAEGIL
jgi:hypothetical protein